MRLTLRLELALTRDRPGKPEAEEHAHPDTESMVIHQDQPRFVGFRREDTDTDDD